MPIVREGIKRKPPKADELPDHLKQHVADKNTENNNEDTELPSEESELRD